MILNTEPSQSTRLACPELVKFVTVGFNSTTRHLENLAQKNNPISLPTNELDPVVGGKGSIPTQTDRPNSLITETKPLVAVFIPSVGESPNLYSHLPILVKTASMAFPHLPDIRLVTLPFGAEARLSEALRLPRVGLISLACDAPGGSEISDLIRTNVPELIVPWLHGPESGVYMPTEISVIRSNPWPKQNKAGKART